MPLPPHTGIEAGRRSRERKKKEKEEEKRKQRKGGPAESTNSAREPSRDFDSIPLRGFLYPVFSVQTERQTGGA